MRVCSAPQNHSGALGDRESTSCSCLGLQQEKKAARGQTPTTQGKSHHTGISLGRISHTALPDFKGPGSVCRKGREWRGRTLKHVTTPRETTYCVIHSFFHTVSKMLTTYQALGQTLWLRYYQGSCSCTIQGAPLTIYPVGVAPPGDVRCRSPFIFLVCYVLLLLSVFHTGKQTLREQ